MGNDSDKGRRKNQSTHFVFSNFSSEIVPFMRKCGKNIVERDKPQMTDNMAHVHCILVTYGSIYTLRLCNTLCFSTVTTVAPPRRIRILPFLFDHVFR
jgi:hypothetical protein